MDNEIEVDFTKLKYVFYTRKSNTDESRQVRSIPDQIKDGMVLAERLGLHVVEILKETKSAKKPHQRPIFNQMLKDIKAGVYDAILAWNPDRLARNMLEGGMLIDMADTGIIKDFKFVTHVYSPDANGKMLLGMAFVLSKQYSDDLSQKVTRGVRRSFEEGKSPAPKHGYIRDENGMYQPDGKNYDLICEAWEMRRQGTSLEQIADNMNKEGYARIVKKSGEKIYMTADILSTQVFPNPFYYGVLISEKTGKIVDLREAYTFTPATTEAVYNEIQLLSKRRTTPLQRRKRLTYYPLKAMVWCAFCSKNMVVGASTSKTGKRYLNYRCDNKQCTRKKKSIRGIKVFDFIYSFLEEGLKLTEKDYVEYYEKLNLLAGQKRQKLSIRLHSLEGSLKAITGEIKDRALGVINIANTRAKKVNEDRITELEAQEEQIKKDIMIIKKQLTDPEQDKLTLEQFLNLSKNAEEIAKSGDAVQKDIICREIFLNFLVDEEKVLSYQLKPPFDELLKYRQLPPSRGAGN